MSDQHTKTDCLTIANRAFHSRLFLGTGKFPSRTIMAEALHASACDMVTVAVRRINLQNPQDNILPSIMSENYFLLPNTAGASCAEEAIRLARLARASGWSHWIKLEVTPDPRYLLPDGEETLHAAKMLIKEGFVVLPYMPADPILAKKLEEIGCAAVMPLGSPIGSNQGLKTLDSIQIIIEQSQIPVVVDAGIGKPSDAALAMECGADAVLVNTAIATATDPVLMADAFRQAVIAGRTGYLAGLSPSSVFAQASSPSDFIPQ